MELMNKSQQEWLKNGGSEDAMKFIDSVVGSLHQKALNEGIVHKAVSEEESDVTEETETKETEDVVEEDTVVNSVESEAVDETVSEEVEEKAVEESENVINFATVLSETIFAAQKQYHEDVIAPLLKELKEVKEELTATKKKSFNLFDMSASDLLPTAAVAAMVSKQYGKKETEIAGDATKAEAITKKEVKSFTDANLFADF